jgi:hypothetical protein
LHFLLGGNLSLDDTGRKNREERNVQHDKSERGCRLILVICKT